MKVERPLVAMFSGEALKRRPPPTLRGRGGPPAAAAAAGAGGRRHLAGHRDLRPARYRASAAAADGQPGGQGRAMQQAQVLGRSEARQVLKPQGGNDEQFVGLGFVVFIWCVELLMSSQTQSSERTPLYCTKVQKGQVQT